jgi:hypothetical protein
MPALGGLLIVGMPDGDGAAVEVEVDLFQAEELAFAHPGPDPERVLPVAGALPLPEARRRPCAELSAARRSPRGSVRSRGRAWQKWCGAHLGLRSGSWGASSAECPCSRPSMRAVVTSGRGSLPRTERILLRRKEPLSPRCREPYSAHHQSKSSAKVSAGSPPARPPGLASRSALCSRSSPYRCASRLVVHAVTERRQRPEASFRHRR